MRLRALAVGLLCASALATAAGCSAPREASLALGAAELAPPRPASAAPAVADAFAGPLAARAAELARTAPPGFSVRVARPFVVVSDEAAAAVDRRVGRVIEPAVAWMGREYFRAEPAAPIAIWLCADAASYRSVAERVTGHAPDTPFGFYSEEHRAIVLDVATGDGTLVHELVHPFVRADFPGCPTWLDEGLGSLYEACRFEGGALRGVVNWRLAALREAAASGSIPRISDLVRLSPDAFYGGGSPLFYATARYLCLWLQERGALAELYRRLRDADPTSIDPAADAERALAELLGAGDAADLDAAFRSWVLGLQAAGSPP
jgi:hypothetical protein